MSTRDCGIRAWPRFSAAHAPSRCDRPLAGAPRRGEATVLAVSRGLCRTCPPAGSAMCCAGRRVPSLAGSARRRTCQTCGRMEPSRRSQTRALAGRSPRITRVCFRRGSWNLREGRGRTLHPPAGSAMCCAGRGAPSLGGSAPRRTCQTCGRVEPHTRKLRGLSPRGSGVRTSPAAVPADGGPSRTTAPSPWGIPRFALRAKRG